MKGIYQGPGAGPATCRKSSPAAIFSARTRFPCACGAAGETCKETLLRKVSESTAHVAGFGFHSEGTEGSVCPVGTCAKRKATRRSQPKRAVGAASARPRRLRLRTCGPPSLPEGFFDSLRARRLAPGPFLLPWPRMGTRGSRDQTAALSDRCRPSAPARRPAPPRRTCARGRACPPRERRLRSGYRKWHRGRGCRRACGW